MTRATHTTRRAGLTAHANGRLSALIGASAAVVCLGGVLTGCAGGGHGGYAAVGPAGAPGAARGGPAGGVTGGVTFVPLDGSADGRTGGGDGDGSPPGSGAVGGTRTSPGTTTAPASPGGSGNPGTPGGTGIPAVATPSAPDARHGRTTAPTAGTTPPAPAALTWTGPELADGAHRWCDEVTVRFHNSGGGPVRSGTVTFGTHVIDALGLDWATVRSTQDLPVPIGAGARTSKSWTVCVEWWRVPLGMHVETRDVSVRWGQS